MAITRTFNDLTYIDTLSSVDSPVHRVDARAKLITFSVFMICVVSFGKYEISALLPYFFFPAVIIPLARIPASFFTRKLVFLLPIAVFMGAFNPFFDRQTLLFLGPVPVSGGVVSFVSILLRFTLTVTAALVLIAVTGFNALCTALERFHVPRAFSMQLMMLYRYLFVLTSEGARMSRARELRAVGGQGLGIRVYGSLLGHLLLRTWHRAQRIHMAMLSRGFTGEFPLRRPFRMGPADIAFMLAWCSLFLFLSMVNLPRVIGNLLLGAGI
jgi:cobalt/nickel transport system permease protein